MKPIEFLGWVLIGLEVLWVLAWFGIMIWFNAAWFDGAEIYEPSHFVDVLHVIGVPALLATLFDLRKGEKTQWLYVFLFVTVVLIDIRGLLHSFVVLVHYLGVTNYWQAHAAISTSGLVLSALELVWFCVVIWIEYRERSKETSSKTEPLLSNIKADIKTHYLKLK
jgi:hypothetical protein